MKNISQNEIRNLKKEIAELKNQIAAIELKKENTFEFFPNQFGKILGNTNIIFLDWDLNNNKLIWSENAETIFGFEPNSFGTTKESYINWIHPDDSSDFLDNLHKKICNKEEFCATQYRLIREDKSIVWIKTSGQITYDKNGKAKKLFGVLIDITEQIKTENQLKERTERYELISKGINDAIWDWNVPKKTTYYSPRWKELRGFCEHEISNREEEWSKGIHPDDKERIFAAIQKHFEEETPFFEEEYRIKCKDGSYKWVLDHGVAQKDNHGNITRMVGSESDITARKQAEENLQEQSNFLTLLLNHIPSQIYWKDKNLIYQGCNQLFATVVGAENPESIVGLTDFDLARNTEFAEKYRKEDQRVLDQKKAIFNIEEPYHNAKGEKGWVSTSKIPLYRKNKLYGLLGISTDITHRKKSEQEQQTNSLRYQALFDNSPVPLWEEDFGELYSFIENLKATGVANFREYFKNNPEALFLCSQKVKVTNVNQATLKLHKAASKQELIGNLDKIFTEKSFEVFREEVIALANDNKEFETEAEIKTLKGEPRQIFLKLTIDNNHEDNAKALLATIDITDKKRTDEALEKSELKFRTSFEASNVGMAIVSVDKKFTSVNNAFCKMLETDKESLLGKSFMDITYSDDFDHSQQKYTRKIANKQAFTIEKRYLTKFGKIRWGLTTVSPIFTSKNELLFTIAHIQDITNRKHSEENLLKSNREYESLTEEYKVQNEELIKAIEIAEKSDRLKTEFLQNLSHEIRTPMNAILGFSDFLDMENITTTKRKQYINIIKNSGHQLLRIIDDILEISALETNHVQLMEVDFELNNLLTELFTIFQPQAKKQNLSLYLYKDLSDDESIIKSDEIKLKKILMNLIENALKYTNTGVIEIGYHSYNNDIELYVKDTGIGISSERHEKIFERFSQANDKLSKNTRGLGLGLSIVKENVLLLGGDLHLSSESGQGSKFSIHLYNCLVQKNCSQTDVQKKHQILLVEDEELNHFYFKSLMEEIASNCKLVHAKNGQEAIELCKNNDFDIVFMDIKMPEMNGYEASIEIKKIKPDITIVAQTAYSTKADKSKAQIAGCSDFISKPISMLTVQQILKKYSII